MKKQFLFIFLFIYSFSYSQTIDLNKLETDENQNIIIYCNSTINVNLFFSSIIDNGTLGNKNFQFGYDADNNGKIGILRGVAGPDTNLLVTTKNGNIYSFIIKFKTDITKFNYFIKSKDKIGNMNDEDSDADAEQSAQDIENEPKNVNKEVKTIAFNDYESTNNSNKTNKELVVNSKDNLLENCKKIIEKGTFFKRYYAEATNVKLHLSNIVYNQDELYFLLTLDNKSSIDYEINDLQFNIIAANTNKVTSTQKIKIEPLYEFNKVDRVVAGQTLSFIYVIKKFTINKEKRVEIALSEVTGERDLVLEISNKYINNPNLN